MVTTLDLDPVYVVLHHSGIIGRELERLLVAYLYYYHLGTASWIVDQPDFHDAFKTAAGSKEYKRSSERRHFRGGQALEAAEWLKNKSFEALWKLVNDARDMETTVPGSKLMEYYRGWRRFGPWASFKLADITERLGLCPVAFSVEDAMYDSPLKEAKVQWAEQRPGEPVPGDKELGRWACGWLDGYLNLDAPPRFERKVGFQEYETVLCKFGSSKKGKYRVGQDIEEVRHALDWRDTPTARKLRAGAVKGGLWS